MQYPDIAQPQYGFAPTMPSMSDMPPVSGLPAALMNFKKGGEVKRTYGLENAAEQLRRKGRNGDTILAHINPEEAGILQLLGGSGRINPYTGLPEFNFLKKAGDAIGSGLKSVGDTVGKVVKGAADELGRAANSIAEALGPVGQIAAAYFGGPIGAAVYAGFAAPGQKFDVKQAAKAGALTYGAGQLSQAMGGSTGGYDVADGGGGFDLGYGASGAEADAISQLGVDQVSALQPPSPSVTGSVPSPAEINAMGPSTAPGAVPISSSGFSAPPPPLPAGTAAAPITDMSVASSSLPSAATSTASGIGSLAGELGSMALKAVTPTSPLDALKIASTAATAYGSIKSLQELEKQREEAEKILREQEKRTAEDIAFAKDVLAKYPMEYRRLTEEEYLAQQARDAEQQNMAGGGLAGLNAFKSGGEPRFLKGGGDGMSDDIPATIGGRQKAALSDGEFVIPADVVSHLGNGSSRAGAKKLYSMMDNIRKARTGKKRQAPEVRADRYMPA